MPSLTIEERQGGRFYKLKKDGRDFEVYRDRVDAEMRIVELNARARLARLEKMGKDTTGFMDNPFID